MTATRKEIEGWLDKLYASRRYSHMIVFCDTFDYEDYPVYIEAGKDVHEAIAERTTTTSRAGPHGGTIVSGAGAMTLLMEVYSRNHSRESQMAERRAFHYD